MTKTSRAFVTLLAAVFATTALMGCADIQKLLGGSSTPETVIKKEEVLVIIAEQPFTVEVGGTRTLTAVANESGKNVEWFSSDYDVAEVDGGVVTGVGVGEANIMALCGDSVAECKVTVVAAGKVYYNVAAEECEHGKVFPSPARAEKGTAITVTAVPDSGYVLTALSYDDNDITSTRMFIMPGKDVTLSATFTSDGTSGGGGASEVITNTIVVAPSTVTLEKDATMQLTVTPAAGTTATWTSSNTDIVTVNNGLVTAKAVGQATVTVVCNGVAAQIKFNVVEKPSQDDGEYAKAGYTLTWHDEFNGSSLDTSKWGYQTGTKDVYGSAYGADYWGNSELQYYTDSATNVTVRDGSLNIIARKEARGDRQYTSARILTRDKFSQTYGYFEARIKMPTGDGMWPAFWMLPQPSTTANLENEYGGWAASGEIDIMEAKGRLQNVVDMTIHYGGAWPRNQHFGRSYQMSTNIDQWHTYAVDWTANEIKWYVDGELRSSVPNSTYNSENATENPSAPFDKPFYILFNLAVGGTYDPDGTSAFLAADNFTSATMYVDYVRAYRKNA